MSQTGTKSGWLGRLTAGLSRSAGQLSQNLSGIFTRKTLDDEQLEALEEALIQADLGPALAADLVEQLREDRFGRDVTDQEVREFLASRIGAKLGRVVTPLIPMGGSPFVVLVVGVNGAGKTTTIGKLASIWRAEGFSVAIAAGDTFRAAAVEQLKIWGERAGVPVYAKDTGADAAGLVHDAWEAARADQRDILLVDTAGRLHNKANLMEELKKIVRVLKKLDPTTPHATVLVLDATTGQNAINQVKVFGEMVQVSGLIVTKLDGSSKGGVVVALANQFKLPIHAVGVGESIEDLQPFTPESFARGLVGLPVER